MPAGKKRKQISASSEDEEDDYVVGDSAGEETESEATESEEATEEDSDATEEEEEEEEDDEDEDTEEEEEEEEEESELEFDEDGILVADYDADTARLAAMPALEREELLFERSESRKKKLAIREARRMARDARRATSKRSKRLKKNKKEPKQRKQRVTKEKQAKRGKRSALADLVARREKKKGGRRVDQVDLEEDYYYENEEGERIEEGPKKRGGRRGGRRRGPDSDETASEDDDRRGYSEEDSEDEKPRTRTEIDLAGIKRLQVRRLDLERHVGQPYFEDFVKSMFCRIQVGNDEANPVYCCCTIVRAEPYKRQYKLGKKETQLGLTCAFAGDERTYPMLQVSNQGITQAEFERWRSKQQLRQLHVVSAEEALLLKKRKNKMITNFVFTPEVVEKLVEQQKESKDRFNHVNPAVYKRQLLDKRDTAKKSGDKELASKLTRELRELEEHRRRKRERTSVVVSADEMARMEARKQRELNNLHNVKLKDEAKSAAPQHKQQAVFGGNTKRPVRKKAKTSDTKTSSSSSSSSSSSATATAAPASSSSSGLMDVDVDERAQHDVVVELNGAAHNPEDPSFLAREEVRALYDFDFDISSLASSSSRAMDVSAYPSSNVHLRAGVHGVLRDSMYTRDPTKHNQRAEVWSLARYSEHLDALADA